MRIVGVILGVLLLIVGGTLAFVPIASTSGTVGANGGTTVLVVQANALLVQQHFTGSWSSSSAVDFFAWDCGTDQPNVNNLNAPCPNPTFVTPGGTASVNGTSGNLDIMVPGGHWLLFSASGPTDVSLKSTYATLGPILLIVGVVILIVGLAMKKKSMPSPAPTSTPATAP